MKIKFLTAAAISASTLLAPNVALAGWVHIGEDVKGKNLYLETTSITRQGVEASFLTDFHPGGGWLPAQSQVRASCKSGDFQLLTSSMLNDPKLVGPGSEVVQAPFGSLMGQAIQYACSNH